MLIGSIGAIQQKKFRRLLAYSSITSTGYYLIVFLFPDFFFVKNIFFYMIVYLINVFGIFISFSNLYTFRTRNILERFTLLAGYYKYNRFFAIILVLLLFSIAGLPPFPSFLAKLYLLFNLFNNNLYFFAFIMIITTILSFYYYLRVSKIILYNKNNNWLYFSNLSYISSLFLMYIILFNLLLILKPSLILIPLEYFLIDLF